MSILKPLFHKELSRDPKSWAKRFQIPEKQILKLLDSKWSIHLKTAEKFRIIFNEVLNSDHSLEDLFEVSELKGSDDREVEYEYGIDEMNEEEKVGIIRYLFEKRLRGHAIRDVLIFLIVLSIAMLLVSYFWKP